jgi:hypothetical protein
MGPVRNPASLRRARAAVAFFSSGGNAGTSGNVAPVMRSSAYAASRCAGTPAVRLGGDPRSTSSHLAPPALPNAARVEPRRSFSWRTSRASYRQLTIRSNASVRTAFSSEKYFRHAPCPRPYFAEWRVQGGTRTCVLSEMPVPSKSEWSQGLPSNSIRAGGNARRNPRNSGSVNTASPIPHWRRTPIRGLEGRSMVVPDIRRSRENTDRMSSRRCAIRSERMRRWNGTLAVPILSV